MTKWLIRKASGSRARHKIKGSFSDQRNTKRYSSEFDNLPQKESMGGKSTHHSYLDTDLVGRWLHSQVGQDFDDVYSAFLARIQPKYLEQYRECIYWYVEDKKDIEIKENGEVWGKWHHKSVRLPYYGQEAFYVHPITNRLQKVEREKQPQ